MEFFNQTGSVALGSRLRHLSAMVTEDAAKIYKLYAIEDFSPKWFPVFFVLSHEGPASVTDIANKIGHSQPSVTKIIREMTVAGLLEDDPDTNDKRKKRVKLAQKGILLNDSMKVAFQDTEAAIDYINEAATLNLWEALAEWEFLLEQKSLFRRVQEQKKKREQRNVKIVDYEPKYRDYFEKLNKAWIAEYFVLEDLDRQILEHPEEYIINKGGWILVALYNNVPMGVCALIKMDDPEYGFEMSKMAVSPEGQGKGIGWLLGQAVARKAKELGAAKIFLESNTILKPAINLYYKMGFRKVAARPLEYARGNIQMELDLSDY